MLTNMHSINNNNIEPPQSTEIVPVVKFVHVGRCRKPITKEIVESLATEKYRINGKGLTIRDLITKYLSQKSHRLNVVLNTSIQLVFFLLHKILFDRV